MHQCRITMTTPTTTKVVTVTAGRDRVSSIRLHLTAPWSVTQCAADGDFITRQLFGSAWSWDMFPERRAAFDAALETYVAAVPDQVTPRTKLPDIRWVADYVPQQSEITARKASVAR